MKHLKKFVDGKRNHDVLCMVLPIKIGVPDEFNTIFTAEALRKAGAKVYSDLGVAVVIIRADDLVADGVEVNFEFTALKDELDMETEVRTIHDMKIQNITLNVPFKKRRW